MLATTGARPVDWLFEHARRCALVPGTLPTWTGTSAAGWLQRRGGRHLPHHGGQPGRRCVRRGPYLSQGGAWGIGSDSHASVSVAEELRLFEYGQRTALQRRNVLASETHPQVADRLYTEAVAGGARAAGRSVAGLAPGQRADFVVLDGAHPALAGLGGAQALAAHVFANHGHETLADVRTAGRSRVRHGVHPLQAEAGRAFAAARAGLLTD